MLISIEGLTNSGKTTLCQNLSKRIPAVYINDFLRSDIVMKNVAQITHPISNLDKFDTRTELLLYLSMLSQKAHYIDYYKNDNKILLVDRFTLSVFAQFYNKQNLDSNFVREIVMFSSNYITPNFTIFLDASLETILDRTVESPLSRKDLTLPYRYDSIRDSYLDNIGDFSENFCIVNCSNGETIEELTDTVIQKIEDFCFVANKPTLLHNKTTNMVWISAGGKGTRMKSLTTSCPKPLLKIGTNCLIEYLCKHLISTGFSKHIIISYCYLKEMWKPFITRYKNHISFSDSTGNSTLVADLLQCVKNTAYDNYIIISGDVIFDYSIIDDLLEKHCCNNSDLSLALNSSENNQWKYWDYIMDSSGSITDIIRRESITHIERYCFIVKRKALEKYTSNFNINLGLENTEFINYEKYNSGWTYLVKRIIDYDGFKVKGYFYSSPVINVNTADDLFRAKAYLSSQTP